MTMTTRYLSIAIKEDENQDKISGLITKIQREAEKLESSGSIIDQIVVSHSNQYESQSLSTIYCSEPDTPQEQWTMNSIVMRASGDSDTKALSKVLIKLNEWTIKNNNVDLYDTVISYHNDKGSSVALVKLYYSHIS